MPLTKPGVGGMGRGGMLRQIFNQLGIIYAYTSLNGEEGSMALMVTCLCMSNQGFLKKNPLLPGTL